jgi:hypothetical protein
MRGILLWVLWAGALQAQTYVGAMGGIATLSADGSTAGSTGGSPPTSISALKPENGAAVWIFAGRHFGDVFSLQTSFNQQTNSLLLASLGPNGAYSQGMDGRVRTVAFEALAYFRARDSKVRPYLSAGPVVSWMRGTPTMPTSVSGRVTLPGAIQRTSPGLRVAVGIDWHVRPQIALRYSFSETLQANPFSQALTPAGIRKLANFQNLWGVAFFF